MKAIKKTILLILVLISLAVLTLRFSNQFASSIFNIKEKAGLRISSTPNGANVYLSGKKVGKTPFEDQNLLSEEYDVKIQLGEEFWQGKVALTPGTLTIVNRELSSDATSSAGEILTLEKGRGATIVSAPSGADVEIDGKSYGQTPVSLKIAEGEHTFNLKKGGYLVRSVVANAPKDFNLIISADLKLSDADLTEITAPVITETPKVLVLSTPTGFLRVREKADVNSKEIAKVTPGNELILLEELDGWDRIRLDSGTEGFVSKSYVEKKSVPSSP